MRRRLLPFLPVLAGAVALTAAPRPARAQLHADLDLELVIGIAPTGLGGSAGADARIGYRFDRGAAWLQPEILLGYQHFAGGAAVGGSLGRLLVGERVGLSGRVQPSLFTHLGGGVGDGEGFTFDAGGALDVQLRSVNLGAHVSYNLLRETGGTIGWLDVGPQIGLTF